MADKHTPLKTPMLGWSVPAITVVTVLVLLLANRPGLARTLDDILQLARQRDQQRQADIHLAAASEADGLRLVAGYGPNLSLSAGVVNARHHDTPKDEEHEEKSANFSEAEALINLEQPLIDFEKGSQALRGLVEMDIAVANRAKTESDLTLKVNERYYGFLIARAQLDLARAESLALREQANNVAERLALGADTITSHHEAEARHRLALAAEISRRIAWDNAENHLEELIDEPLGPVDDVPEGSDLPSPAGSADSWRQTAKERNSDLKIRELQAEVADHEYRTALSRFLPSLKLYATYRDRTASDGLAGYGEERQELEAGLRLDLQLLAGGRDSAATLSAANRAKAAKARAEATRRELDKRVVSLWQSLQNTIHLITANRHAAEENHKALTATQAAYDQGAKTLLDLLNAQQSHYRALGAYRTSRYDYLLLLERLHHAGGGKESAKHLADETQQSKSPFSD